MHNKYYHLVCDLDCVKLCRITQQEKIKKSNQSHNFRGFTMNCLIDSFILID